MSGVQTSVAAVLALDDLLIEIILCFPSIFLVRLQLVSKRWQSLIYSPDFRLARHCRPSPPSFILPTYGVSGDFFYCGPHQKLLLGFRFKPPYTIIVASHNGLILLTTDQRKTYKVYNPTTGKSRKLPRPPCKSYPCANFNSYLGYEPTKSPDYRVIRVSYDSVYVYESNSRRWRRHRSSSHYVRDGVYCNGKLYWIPMDRDSYSSYLDLRTGKSRNFPSIQVDGKCDLLESRGRVYGVFTIYEEKYLDVFLLSEDNSYWSKICRLNWSFCLNGSGIIISGVTRFVWSDPDWPVSTIRGEEPTVFIDMLGQIISLPVSASGEGSKMIFDIGENFYYRDVYKFTECFVSV